MRAFGLAVVAATITGGGRGCRRAVRAQLEMLAPAERLEQLCDYTAMTRIRTEKKEFRPDRAVANAMAEPTTPQAIRSKSPAARFAARRNGTRCPIAARRRPTT